jgi:hypothetical protein
MKKVLWFSVVFKNKKPSDLLSLMVGKGGFEPPTLLFFQNNFNRLRQADHKPCGSLWLRFLKSSEYAHNDRLIKFLVFIRLQEFLRLKTINRRTTNEHKFI